MPVERRVAAALLGVALVSTIGACKEEGIRAYRAPKEPVPGAVAAGPADTLGVAWTAPPGWREIQSSQPSRVATFNPGEGLPEVAINVFPGDTGGLLANVNRWR